MRPKTDYALPVWNQGIYRGFALGGKLDHHIIVLNALSDIAVKFFNLKLKVFACFKFSNIVRS